MNKHTLESVLSQSLLFKIFLKAEICSFIPLLPKIKNSNESDVVNIISYYCY